MGVRYIHNFDRECPFGGETFAFDIVDGKLFVGISHCSEKDMYSKEVGKRVAHSYLDEIVHQYRSSGVSCISIGTELKKYKITGLVIDEKLFFHLAMTNTFDDDYEYIKDVEKNVLKNTEFTITKINYDNLRGGDLKRVLCTYYNIVINTMFPNEKELDFLYPDNIISSCKI